MEIALKTDQAAGAKFLEQNRELRQIARGNRDTKPILPLLSQPDQFLFAREVADRRKKHEARTEKGKKEYSYGKVKDQTEKHERLHSETRWKETALLGKRVGGNPRSR